MVIIYHIGNEVIWLNFWRNLWLSSLGASSYLEGRSILHTPKVTDSLIQEQRDSLIQELGLRYCSWFRVNLWRRLHVKSWEIWLSHLPMWTVHQRKPSSTKRELWRCGNDKDERRRHTILWGPDRFPTPEYKPQVILHTLIFWDNFYLVSITHFCFIWLYIAFLHKLSQVSLSLMSKVFLETHLTMVVVGGGEICLWVQRRIYID